MQKFQQYAEINNRFHNSVLFNYNLNEYFPDNHWHRPIPINTLCIFTSL